LALAMQFSVGIALCLVAASMQSQDGDSEVSVLDGSDWGTEHNSLQADLAARKSMVNGTKAGKASKVAQPFLSESYYNSGTFSYSVSAPGPTRQRTDPGNGEEESLAGEEMGEGNDSRTTNFQYIERTLGAAVDADGSIHRDRVLQAILNWNKAQRLREHAALNTVSLLQELPGRGNSPKLNSTAKKISQKEKQPEAKSSSIMDGQTSALKMAKLQLEQQDIRNAQEQAKELAQKAAADAKEVEKASKRDRDETIAGDQKMAAELKGKKTQELAFKEKTQKSENEKQQKEKLQEKRAKAAEKKAQEAKAKAAAIKEALEKAQTAATKSEAQEKVSKDASEKYTKHSNEIQEKNTIIKNVKGMESLAAKDVAENSEKKTKEDAEKKKKEKGLSDKYKTGQKQIEIRGKQLTKQLAKKAAEEKKTKRVQEKSLKKKQQETNKAIEAARAKAAAEASHKKQLLKKRQKSAMEKLKKLVVDQRKRSEEQSVKAKEGATKAEERAKKRADKEVQDLIKETKLKAVKETKTKGKKSAALKAAIAKKQESEKKYKSEMRQTQTVQTGEERTQKTTVLSRNEQDKRASIKDQKQRGIELANEHKMKAKDLEKVHRQLKSQVIAKLGVATANHKRLESEMAKREAKLKKTKAALKKSRKVNDEASKKTFTLVQDTNTKSTKAKELSDKMKEKLSNVKDNIDCPLKKYMDVLSDSGLIGSSTQGICKISCRLDTNFGNGIKVPCQIDEGGKAACEMVLTKRAHSAASLGMKQYGKWKACRYSTLESMKVAHESGAGDKRGKKVNFVDFMGKLQSLKGKNGNIPTGMMVDMLYAQCPTCGKKTKKGKKEEFGEDSSIAKFSFGEDNNEGAFEPDGKTSRVSCDTTQKIKSDLKKIQPSETEGCLVNCQADVSNKKGYSVKCSGSGNGVCFLNTGQQYHQEVADTYFVWKTMCSKPSDPI